MCCIWVQFPCMTVQSGPKPTHRTLPLNFTTLRRWREFSHRADSSDAWTQTTEELKVETQKISGLLATFPHHIQQLLLPRCQERQHCSLAWSQSSPSIIVPEHVRAGYTQLTPWEHWHHHKLNLCIYCGQASHFVFLCKDREFNWSRWWTLFLSQLLHTLSPTL